MRSLAATAAVALLAIAAAGCADGPAPTTSPATSDLESTPPAASPAAAATASPGSSKPAPTSILVLPHDDPGLEALLPDAVDGQKLFKLSVGLISSGTNEDAAAMRQLAKEIGDGTGNFGLAYAGDDVNQKFNLFALRIPGAEPNKLLTEYARLTLGATAGGTAESDTLGGRSLVHILDPGSQIGDVWFYATGDTLLGVQAGSPEMATKLLALLP